MINFPCKCGYAFSVPEDQAGGMIQCPACHLLADVPKLSDLASLNPDGTFAFEESLLEDDTTAADLHRVFTNKTVDSHGVEKDLRSAPERFAAIGMQENAPQRVAPRYDPVTGELIRPLQLKDETPTPAASMGTLVDESELDPADLDQPMPVMPIPMATLVGDAPAPKAKPQKLAYAMGDTRRQVTLKTLAIELLMPANSVVLFFVFLLYVIGFYITSGMASYVERLLPGRVWPFLIVNLPMWLVGSHIACVIEHTGPDAVDELPRPLRDFSLGDDFFTPLMQTILAVILCFWPMVLAIRLLDWENPAAVPVIFAIGFAGAFFFPGVLLTTVTGTTIANLTPGRLVAVIRLCGGQYFCSIALFILAAIPTTYYFSSELLFRPRPEGPIVDKINSPTLMLPLMMIAVYLLHFFGWHMGLMYRQHHEQFPWLLQRHIKRNATNK